MVIMDKVVKGKVTKEPEKEFPKPEKTVIVESEEDKPKQRNKKK